MLNPRDLNEASLDRLSRIHEIIQEVNCPPWKITMTVGRRNFIAVSCPGDRCAVTGEPYAWKGRKWMISEWMTETEVVNTCLKAVLAAAEHEIRERFHYQGVSLYNPHIKVQDLIELRQSKQLDGRDE